MKHHYQCIKCNKIYSLLKDICTHDPYYDYVDVLYDYKSIKKLPYQKRKSLLNRLLPTIKGLMSLGEGNTPLVRIKNFSSECKDNFVYVKNEGQNPTGSFKDRESALIISKAKELGYKKVVIVSSGNAALSSAVYANKAGMQCECFIPHHTSKTKKQILQLYSSNFHTMHGDYESIYRKIADSPVPDAWNITTGQNFYREEGSKKISYEIWEAIGVPDIMIIPIGNGSLFAATYKGFIELKKVGLTNKIPLFVGVQVKDASPIAEAMRKKIDHAILERIPDSVAEGIIARESYSSPKVVKALRENGGKVVEVTDQEIVSALKDIIRIESFTPEPTSAVVYAALKKLGLKTGGNKIVCIQTSNGMKNLEEILEVVK
ncbi:MAG: pyridoxal-phosphate dependent enzyme [bacterium]|nr:pyridoxal-phosphate dependent enzyme [bacterium]